MANIKELFTQHAEATKILRMAGELGQESKTEVYVVGGVVRDLMLGKDIHEIDIMVVGDGIEFADRLAKRMGVKKIVPFKNFGTAQIPNKSLPTEVASARTESYNEDSRKPKEVQYTDLKGDLIRRDFTINTMAVDVRPDHFGDLHDPFGGIQDIHKKRLVTPLDPDETFSDDPLRMMRAAYFASKLQFTIDESCIESMKRQADRLNIVSKERITGEILKILASPKPSIGLTILQETGLMKQVFPEIHAMYGMQQTPEFHHKDVFYHTLQVVDNTARLTDKMEIRFAALVHDIAKPITRRIDKKKGYTFHGHDAVGERMLIKVAKRMKLSNNLRDYLKKMTLLHLRPIVLAKKEISDSAVRRLMVLAGDDIDDLMKLCRADITSKNPEKVKKYMGNFERVEALMKDVVERDKMRSFQSPVRGDEIMKVCELREGKSIGKIKSAIEEAILDGEIENTYEAAYEYMLQIKENYI
ncbi:MAG: HD domain-containing protein [Candidatus Marinimicrobia bacterium]|nr:HD domain-containing protein [Candidatus Neomarinimicrobiota bacterium]